MRSIVRSMSSVFWMFAFVSTGLCEMPSGPGNAREPALYYTRQAEDFLTYATSDGILIRPNSVPPKPPAEDAGLICDLISKDDLSIKRIGKLPGGYTVEVYDWDVPSEYVAILEGYTAVRLFSTRELAVKHEISLADIKDLDARLWLPITHRLPLIRLSDDQVLMISYTQTRESTVSFAVNLWNLSANSWTVYQSLPVNMDAQCKPGPLMLMRGRRLLLTLQNGSYLQFDCTSMTFSKWGRIDLPEGETLMPESSSYRHSTQPDHVVLATTGPDFYASSASLWSPHGFRPGLTASPTAVSLGIRGIGVVVGDMVITKYALDTEVLAHRIGTDNAGSLEFDEAWRESLPQGYQPVHSQLVMSGAGEYAILPGMFTIFGLDAKTGRIAFRLRRKNELSTELNPQKVELTCGLGLRFQYVDCFVYGDLVGGRYRGPNGRMVLSLWSWRDAVKAGR